MPPTSARPCTPSTLPATRSFCLPNATPRWPVKWPEANAEPQRKAELRKDRRGLLACAGACAAQFPRGAAILLVLPPGRHHRVERLGFLQPRPSRPAPVSVLRKRTGGGNAHPGKRARIAGMFLRQIQQPSRAAQGRRHRRGKRHLHRLRQHQYRRPAARRLGRFERDVPHPARHRGRVAPAPAQHQHPAFAQKPRGIS